MAAEYIRSSTDAYEPPNIAWRPAYDQVVTDARITTATTTHDTVSGSTSRLTQSSGKVSNTVISVFHTITENGTGGFLNALGVINYGGKTVTLKVVDPSTTATTYNSDTESGGDFASATNASSSDPGSSGFTGYTPASGSSSSGNSGGSSSSQGGSFGNSAVSETLDNTLWVTYRTGTNAATPHTESYTPNVVTIDLAPYTTNRIVPNSIRFTWMGQVYEDIDGVLYRGTTTTTVGTKAGVVDYVKGVAYVTDYVVSGSPTNFVLNSLLTSKGNWTTSRVFFRTPTAPIKPGGFVMTILDVSGVEILATADGNGKIIGDHCLGTIDYQTGVVDMIFGDQVLDSAVTVAQKLEWWYPRALAQITAEGKVWKPWPVDPLSLRYNAVSYFYLPLDADILGLDPVRLPQDGRVAIFRPGGFAVVGNTASVSATVSNGQVINCGSVRLSRVRVLDANGAILNTGYSADLESGLVTINSTSGWAQPVTIENRIEDMVQVSDVQINGKLGFTRPVTHSYPLGSYVSSALISQDLKARVSIFFDQGTWNGITWLDVVSGDPATGTYNGVLSPMVVTNIGAVTERWCLRFTSSTAFQIIGEHVGVIGTGSINTVTNPINPATQAPYFTLPLLGWGIGWAAGNVLRFNTVGAMFPVWVVRTIQQGVESVQDDSFVLLVRGDVDRP